ncbi:MAG: peptidyl-tRNA hydrolase Pth2 [Proteobacteria bacterium]|jgi:PTH2 family peptidyl-tRNA hydrolase|nr:peptidyl-tRNA hydrolase Pth2 [Pseudomonadota bacterium]
MTTKFLYKQVIVVREDLKMSPGKLAVQVAHASVGVICNGSGVYRAKATLENWFAEGFRKIVLRVPSAKEIIALEGKCAEHNLPFYTVYDFGLTELDPNTLTCIGIGPDLNENIDKITGRLGLWK